MNMNGILKNSKRFQNSVSKVLSGLTAAVCSLSLLAGGASFLTVRAEQPITLTIDKVEYIEPETQPTDADGNPLPYTADVTIRVTGNTAGYRAAEFGIDFDDRLTLKSASIGAKDGVAFNYAANRENHLIWMGLAASDAQLTAMSGRSQLVTLTFIMPENRAIGDVYAIGFSWYGVDGSPAYWYAEPGVDKMEDIAENSFNGCISIPDPSAPRLSQRELQMNKNAKALLEVQGYDGDVTWFSDHPEIADVANGIVQSRASGYATVYALAGSTLLTCDVSVTQDYYYSVKDEGIITITSPDDEVYLLFPEATGLVTWLTTNPAVVDVDKNGRLYPGSNGMAQILATSNGVTVTRMVAVQCGETATTATETQPTTTTAEPTTTTTETTTTTDPPVTYAVGDVDGSGKADLVDVVLINRNLLGLCSLTPEQQAAADIYKDGFINSTDSLTLLRYTVSLIKSLPVMPA